MIANTQPDALLRSDDITNDHRPGPAVGIGQALRIGTDASIETIDLTPCDTGRFGATIRQAIGCRLYTVTDATERIDMWTDDEGMPDLGDVELVAATLNPLATLLLAEYRAVYQPYFGVALFTGRSGEHTAGLHPAQLTDLRGRAEALAARPSQLEVFRRRIIAAAARHG
ncbi:DUF3846 domain-containing protein [Mycolicibacterium palauense]|uniref:DUF3846 domain-containing protein n=1 Tax=Mycolicibacterium palauense TaxID=2034511 RepID=UPI000BFEBFD2|nr:hypothetical protein [Mycolicibacterium palauense]